jgi:hypothetical protein
MRELYELGFKVSLARQVDKDENAESVDGAFREIMRRNSLPEDTTIVAFPDFLAPGSNPLVPHVTQNCMTSYQTEQSRKDFMCAFSKMIVKQNGHMRVYACTLVDDDSSYDLGGSLKEAMTQRVMLHHHRCYSCFAFGSSCSELS